MTRYTYSWGGGQQYIVYDKGHAMARCLDRDDAALVAEALNEHERLASALAKGGTRKIQG